jgi:hypothetical protein
MAEHKTSPQREKMIRVNQTHFSTQNHMALSPPLTLATADWTREVVNYPLSTIDLTYDAYSGTMHSSSLAQFDNQCKFDSSYCYAGNDLVTWSLPRNDSCQLTKHRANACYLTPEMLVCPSLAISVSDYRKSTQDTCGTNLGVVRALISNTESDSDKQTSKQQGNGTETYQVSIHFESLYESLRLGQPQFISMTHVTSCGLYPTDVQIQPDLLTKTRYAHPDSEFIDPVLYKTKTTRQPPMKFSDISPDTTPRFREELDPGFLHHDGNMI